MSAPDTNIETQTERHKTPLAGISGVAVFAMVLLFGLVIYLAANGNTPRDASEPAAPTPVLVD